MKTATKTLLIMSMVSLISACHTLELVTTGRTVVELQPGSYIYYGDHKQKIYDSRGNVTGYIEVKRK